jgi:hypothetical protein
MELFFLIRMKTLKIYLLNVISSIIIQNIMQFRIILKLLKNMFHIYHGYMKNT